jgi:pimeloyl-ACP methyl ester carboxylesterase
VNTIILIHGMWSHSGTVAGLKGNLESFGYRVLTPDLPGHDPKNPDRSTDHGRRSIEDYARYVGTFIDEQELTDPPVLMGHSMGGLVAQKVAASRPTGPLVLLNSAQPRGINIIYPSSARATMNILGTPAFWQRPHCPSYRRARYGLFNRLPESDARRIHQSLIPESGRAYFEIVFWFLDRRRVSEIEPTRLVVPILAVTGADDRIVPPIVVRRIAEKYPSASFVCYPNHGHWLFEESGCEKIVADIDRWLKAHTVIN